MLLLLPRGVKDLTGRQDFGDLTPLSIVEVSKKQGAIWLCECKCGGTRKVPAQYLLARRIKRCEACARKARTLRLVKARLERGDSESAYRRNWRSYLDAMTPLQRAVYADMIRRRMKMNVPITDEVRAGCVEAAMITKAA